MKVLTPGHRYVVHHVGDDGDQIIQFVQRRDIHGEPFSTHPHFKKETPGILSQELIRVLIDRTLYLNAEEPCLEDVEIVKHLRDALTLYEARAARKNIEKIVKVEEAEVCDECHHILCHHR